MRQRRMISPLLLSVSLLLAPAGWAQQEVIDPQPSRGRKVSQHPQPLRRPAPYTTRAAIPSPGYQQTHPAGRAGAEQYDCGHGGERPPRRGSRQDPGIDGRPQSGRIQRVVVSFGGTLGVNEKRVEIPWEALTIGLGKKELVVEMTRSSLGKTSVGRRRRSHPLRAINWSHARSSQGIAGGRGERAPNTRGAALCSGRKDNIK